MKSWFKILTLAAAAVLGASPSVWAENEGADVRILHAKKVFNDIVASDKPIPKEILADSNVIIIFPNVGKGGFLYAGRYGLGVVMARNPETGQWSAPAFMRISGGSFGLQAGLQFGELVLVGKAKYKFEKFNGGPAVSGAMTATAGWWGLHSEIGNGWEAPGSMYWFSRNRGLFGSLSLDGNVMSYDQGATSAYYGRGVIAQDVLFANDVRPSPTGQMLVDDVSKYEGKNPAPLTARISQMIPKISFAAPQENGRKKQIQVPSWMPRWGAKK